MLKLLQLHWCYCLQKIEDLFSTFQKLASKAMVPPGNSHGAALTQSIEFLTDSLSPLIDARGDDDASSSCGGESVGYDVLDDSERNCRRDMSDLPPSRHGFAASGARYSNSSPKQSPRSRQGKQL
jgi:hypothetical protein